MPYECGSDVIGSPRARFEVKFYQVAIVFLVFDIETAFLYPWAVNYRELSCAGPLDGTALQRRRRRSSGWARCWCSWASWSSRSPTSGASAPSGGSRRHGLSRRRDDQGRGGASTGRASSRSSSTRSSPPAAAWSSWRVAAPKYDIARFGAEFPRFSPRQADLLIIVGTITERQGPALRRIYEQMCEPKWVIAFGVCASTGGFYQNYSTMPGADQVDPGRRLHPRLPAAARAGARRPDHAAGPDPARRGPQPGRDRRREGREEGDKLRHRLRRRRPWRSARASKRAR